MTEPDFTSRLFGIETEYGLLVEDKGAQDLMDESRLLVRAYPGPWAGPWDYRAEDPRRDIRGYRVDHLSYDPVDARYDKASPSSHLSGEEQRSDRALTNGARFYNDHGHPEYSTPECRSLRDVVAHDKAGERIVLECARLRAEATRRDIRVFKNNTDFHGMSYGCHEGYLCDRAVPFEKLLQGMIPFLVTRILYAGAGKTGVEAAGHAGVVGSGPFAKECLYQISQRADFFTEEASVDTLAKRPIFNTRDEAHADPRKYRRLHVICGDANLSEFATALKVGTTSLVLSLIETGWEPLFRLKHPVDAIKCVSRDPSFRWILELEDGRTMRATDIQRIYLQDAQKLLAGGGPDADWTLREWERVLNDLETDVYRTGDRLDWVAKRRLLETYIEAEGLEWEDEILRSLDLEYHQIDPEFGLYYALEEAGEMARVVTEEEIRAAVEKPPEDTRAAVRGELVRRFASEIARVSWGRVGVKHGTGTRWFPLAPEWGNNGAPGGASQAGSEDWLSVVKAAKTIEEAIAALSASSGEHHVPNQG
jgi:Pup amidohydrolase